MLSLKSRADITSCTYKVTFKLNENNFVNKYYMNNGGVGVLKNQLVLRLNGYKNSANGAVPNIYDIDVLELTNDTYVIDDIVLASNAKDNTTTTHNWGISISFRNYRDYNQNINANKKAVGTITFELKTCERKK